MQSKTKLKSIQALRGIAVLAVVIFHSHWAVSWKDDHLLKVPLLSDYGYLGVNFFFCISGFVICHVISRDSVFSVRNFIIRRIAKIYPIYFLANITIVAIWLFTPIFDKEVISLGFWGVIGSFLAFPLNQYPLLSPGWSLEHEILFYLISGLIVAIANIRLLPIALLILFLAGIKFTGWDFHLFSRYQIYFAAGILSYYLSKYPPLPMLLLAAVAIWLTISSTNMYAYDVFLALGFMAFISGCVSLERRGFHFPRLLFQIGEASYSLYLAHALIFIFFSTLGYRIGAPVEAWRWASVIAAILLSYLIYMKVEEPLHKGTLKLLLPNKRDVELSRRVRL